MSGRAQQLIAQGAPPPAADSESDIIGGYAGPASKVPPGATIAMTGPQGGVPIQAQMDAAVPVYRRGDEKSPAGMPAEEVAALQQALARAGVLSGEFTVGLWDAKSASAYKKVLALANQEGTTDMQALNLFANAPRAGGPASFDPGGFLPPDPAVYRQAVRQMFTEALDRDPDEDELDDYVSALRRSERRAFRAAAGQFDDMAAQGGPATATAFSEVYGREQENVAAKFRERFEAKYAPEVEFKQRQAVNMEQGNLLAAILGTVDQVA